MLSMGITFFVRLSEQWSVRTISSERSRRPAPRRIELHRDQSNKGYTPQSNADPLLPILRLLLLHPILQPIHPPLPQPLPFMFRDRPSPSVPPVDLPTCRHERWLIPVPGDVACGVVRSRLLVYFCTASLGSAHRLRGRWVVIFAVCIADRYRLGSVEHYGGEQEEINSVTSDTLDN